MIFNGVDLEQYFEGDFIVKDVRGRTITQNELETLSIPLANGEILIDSKIPPKVLEVDIALNANTKRDLNKKIDELNSIIHTKETVPIILKDEPDMTYYGILGTSKEDPEEANVHEATLNIMVLDGLKYGPQKQIKVVRNLLGTKTNFDDGKNYLMINDTIPIAWSNVDTKIGGRNLFSISKSLTDTALVWVDGRSIYEKDSVCSNFMRVSKTEYLKCNYVMNQILFYNEDFMFIGLYSNGVLKPPGTLSGTSHSDIVIPNNTDIAYMRIGFRQSFLDGASLFDKKVSVFKGTEAFVWRRAPEDFNIQIAKNSNSRLYEIDEETYNKLNADPEFSGDKLVEKFPFTEPPQTMFLQGGLKETITYEGTAPVIPEIEIIPSEKTTYAGYTNGEKSVLVGYPIDVESIPYDKEPIFFNNVMSDRSNWTDATSMHGITVGGSYSTSSYGLFPIAYGTGTTWHGPSVIRTLNEALTDFTLSTYIGLANTSLSQMSKLEWHLLSADNEIQARILFGDFWAGYNRSIAEFYIGNSAIEKKIQLLDDRWAKDFKGVVQIRKEGNRIELYVARTNPSPHHQIKKTVFIDTENRFNKPITKIQLATCQWGTNPTADPRYIQILLRKINPSKNDMVPYIADIGDKITIDKALNVRKNDQLQLGLNVFSQPIELQKGENTLIALPSTADVTVRFREVFK